MTQIISRPYHRDAAKKLIAQGIDPILARIYTARGITDAAQMATALSGMINPATLKNIHAAAEFLAQAIENNKKITIVADYDCDGATACAVAVRGLKMLKAHVDYIVPNRFDNGYGLTPKIAQAAREYHQTDVLVTVDNGIASLEGIAQAQALGMQVVVTDHHLPGDALPDGCIIVNPNQPTCHFTSKALAGVGVIFYVLLALRAKMREQGKFDLQTQPRFDSLLDLVALGTYADVVTLDANNRILVSQGLKRIRSGHMRPGIAALFRVAGRDFRRASAFDLGFALGPRLNAAGRLSDMSLGIECLLSDDEQRAYEMANQLNEINNERREIEADMSEQAQEQIEKLSPQNQASICVHADDWHQGIIGILAARIKEKYYRPTIAFASGKDGKLYGSCRSIPSFHIRDALDMVSKKHPGLILQFGGHAMAAGLTLAENGFEDFAQTFEAVAEKWLTKTQLERAIVTDGSLPNDYFTTDFIGKLERQVWGHGFDAPIFCDEFQVINQRVVKDKHLRLLLQKDGQTFQAIWFGHTAPLHSQAQVAYRLTINEFNARQSVQLIVEHATS